MCDKDRYIPVCFSPSGGRCRNSKLVQRIVDGKIVDVRRQGQTLAASGIRNAAVYKKDRVMHVCRSIGQRRRYYTARKDYSMGARKRQRLCVTRIDDASGHINR